MFTDYIANIIANELLFVPCGFVRSNHLRAIVGSHRLFKVYSVYHFDKMKLVS